MGFLCNYHSREVTKIKQNIVADISNIAGYYSVFPPKIENIKIMYNTLKFEYWIIGIADWKLYNCIDYLGSYKYYLGRGIITQAPPKIAADILMIMTAIKLDCLIVTNDNLGEYEEIIPSEFWLKSHRVPFDITNSEFRIYLPK